MMTTHLLLVLTVLVVLDHTVGLYHGIIVRMLLVLHYHQHLARRHHRVIHCVGFVPSLVIIESSTPLHRNRSIGVASSIGLISII